MALIRDGREIPTETGFSRPAKDMAGNPVAVSASQEALQDFAWHTAWQAAERKYARGVYEQNGETRLVRVTTADC